jgi:sugar-specific transcriptional regulator TrmB
MTHRTGVIVTNIPAIVFRRCPQRFRAIPLRRSLNRKKKETEQKVRSTKATLKDVTITETVESNVRNDQHGREKNEKAIRTETKTNLRDVNMAVDTVESEVRKEQHTREKDWKATGRQQKAENTSFDMARALFN